MDMRNGYVIEKYQSAYVRAMNLKDYGDDMGAGQLLGEAAYYLSKIIDEGLSSDEEADRAQVDKLYKMSEILIQRAQSTKKKMMEQSGERSSSHRGSGGGPAEDTGDMSSFFSFLPVDSLKVGFDDVVGLDDAKRIVNQYVIYPKQHPDLYNYEFLPNRGILLFGPPGTGKTMFAKAVAKELDQPFALIKMSGLLDCYVGETSKHIDALFEYLRNYTETNQCGVTLFFDEFDEVAKKRGGNDKASETAVPSLLRNLDGMLANRNFLVLANTNCADDLDPAILQRFPQRVPVPLPTLEARRLLFDQKTRDIEAEYRDHMDFGLAAERSQGMSGRDIAFICDDFKYTLGDCKAGIRKLEDINDMLWEVIKRRRAGV